jgi:predicted Zn-dependent protease
MAEETDHLETGAGAAVGIDPAAISIAFGVAAQNDQVAAKAAAFLDEQTALTRMQKEHMHEQRLLLISHLKWRRFNDRAKGALQVMTAVVGLAVAAGISYLVWDATHSTGLIIEAFSMPPNLVARGLTGEVVASQLLGDLSEMQTQTLSVRTPSSYTNNWGDDIKVEIPQTGVSISEFDRFLHQWLGHDTHISGAVYRTAAGIAVTARVDNDMVAASTGSDADLNQLLQKTSEAIYRTTQPFRYARYLFLTNHREEAESAFKALIANGSAQDRFWSNAGRVDFYRYDLDYDKFAENIRRALALRPNSFFAYNLKGEYEREAQHDEVALSAFETAIAAKRDPDISNQAWVAVRVVAECEAASLRGDYQNVIEFCRQADLRANVVGTHAMSQLLQMSAFGAMHDAAGLHDAYAALPPPDKSQGLAEQAGVEALAELGLGNWSALLDKRASLESGLTALTYKFYLTPTVAQPAIAYALALSGDLVGAHTEIDKTPADCSVCLRIHGRIDALEKDWGGATYWFTRAVKDAPSTPFPYSDWGQMLLEKGDPDAAIEKLKLANQKGPRFADPLEMWGEALMAKNRSDLAVAKFAEADKYAPNWGRLHLKWGEALFYAGRKDEAKKQFAAAQKLELPATEMAELVVDEAIRSRNDSRGR